MDEGTIEVGKVGHEQLGQAMRTLLVAIGGYMAGKGWIDANIATAAVPVLLMVAPLAWGQFRVIKTNNQRRRMAEILPDSIATTK